VKGHVIEKRCLLLTRFLGVGYEKLSQTQRGFYGQMVGNVIHVGETLERALYNTIHVNLLHKPAQVLSVILSLKT